MATAPPTTFPKIAFLPIYDYIAPPTRKRDSRPERPPPQLRDGQPEYLFCAPQGGKEMAASSFILKVG